MIVLIVYIIALIIFLVAPLPLQIIFMIANFYIPDPIPVIDEALMMASIIKKIINGLSILGVILDFKEKHPGLFKMIVLGIILLIAMIIKGC